MAYRPSGYRGFAVTATVLLALPGAGCKSLFSGSADDGKIQTSANAFSYHPINPLTVWIKSNELDGLPPTAYRQAFLDDFSSDATRIGMYKVNANGSFSSGVVSSSADGETYSMVIDFIKYMTISIPVRVYEASSPAQKPTVTERIKGSDDTQSRKPKDAPKEVPARVRYLAIDASPSSVADRASLMPPKSVAPPGTRVVAQLNEDEVDHVKEIFAGSMPVYVGVGVRVRADFKSFKGDVKIAGLPGLSAEAAAGNIRGTLSVQTMGIGGREITPLMRIPSDLSIASIQTAIETATSVKLKIYEDNTVVQPVVVGFESPVTDRDVIAELTSFIYSHEMLVELKKSRLITTDGKTDLIWPYWSGDKKQDQSTGSPNAPTDGKSGQDGGKSSGDSHVVIPVTPVTPK